MKARSWRRAVSLAAIAVVLALAALGGASSASAAQSDPPARVAQTNQVERQVIVEFGDPVVVQRGERVQTVVSIGGDVTIAGTVDQTRRRRRRRRLAPGDGEGRRGHERSERQRRRHQR